MKNIAFPVHTHTTHTYSSPAGAGPWYNIGFDTPLIERTEEVFAPESNAKIRRGAGHTVSTFEELAHCIARLAVYNPRLFPLFRGQTKDYLDAKGGTMLYPSIFRKRPRITKKTVQSRFAYLKAAVNTLKRDRDLSCAPLAAHTEMWWSLLQHYELAPTPLLDVTQNLRMAATFALCERDCSGADWRHLPEGFVYVLGLPHAPACLSHMVDEEMVLIRLQSVCPPAALRPHFQEGFLVGRWPLSLSKVVGDNAAYRLIGKYRLDNSKNGFWGNGFQPVPRNVVYPSPDFFEDELKRLLATMGLPRPQ